MFSHYRECEDDFLPLCQTVLKRKLKQRKDTYLWKGPLQQAELYTLTLFCFPSSVLWNHHSNWTQALTWISLSSELGKWKPCQCDSRWSFLSSEISKPWLSSSSFRRPDVVSCLELNSHYLAVPFPRIWRYRDHTQQRSCGLPVPLNICTKICFFFSFPQLWNIVHSTFPLSNSSLFQICSVPRHFQKGNGGCSNKSKVLFSDFPLTNQQNKQLVQRPLIDIGNLWGY